MREGGAVLSTAISCYVYVIAKHRFDDQIRLGYSTTELTDSVDKVQHDLVRESLRVAGIKKGVEITTLADIPSKGSGLGSSSTVTVGLLHSMQRLLGKEVGPGLLAQQACGIEIDALSQPIGVQDQYIAAFGGLRFMQFDSDGRITVERVLLPESVRSRLSGNLMLFFTGSTRRAESVLGEQSRNVAQRLPELRELRSLSYAGREHLERSELDEFGALLGQAWEIKKKLASQVSNTTIDSIYAKAKKAGALGGKVCGAGAGGFLLLYCPPERQEYVRTALSGLRELFFDLDPTGSTAIYEAGHYSRHTEQLKPIAPALMARAMGGL